MREGNLGRLPNIAESPNITMRMVVDILKVIQSEKQNTEVDYKKVHEKLISLDSWKVSCSLLSLFRARLKMISKTLNKFIEQELSWMKSDYLESIKENSIQNVATLTEIKKNSSNQTIFLRPDDTLSFKSNLDLVIYRGLE